MIWWTESWNPIIGCTKCSLACENCYAEALHTQRHKAWRAGKKMAPCYSQPFDQVRFLPERLEQPLHWKKPQRIFVCNMGDLFHEDMSHEILDFVFAVMARCPQHTFMLCTKRPEIMAEYIQKGSQAWLTKESDPLYHEPVSWPLPNVWLGTTIWDQPSAERNLFHLLSTPAAKRFVSVEPMLGPVDMFTIRHGSDPDLPVFGTQWGLDWVICGGETGAKARPMHPDWPRSLRDQCQAAGVPFFFKQWGEFVTPPKGSDLEYEAARARGATDLHVWPDGGFTERVGKKFAGRVLDGREWSEVPNV